MEIERCCLSSTSHNAKQLVSKLLRQQHAFSVVGPILWNELPLAYTLCPGFIQVHFVLAIRPSFSAGVGSRVFLSSSLEHRHSY